MKTKKQSIQCKGRRRSRAQRPSAERSRTVPPLGRNECSGSRAIAPFIPTMGSLEDYHCMMCGRPGLRIREQANVAGRIFIRIPKHQRHDFDRHARSGRRRAPNRAARNILRARAIAERLPASEEIQRRLHQLDNRVFLVRAKKEQARAAMPKDPKRLLRVLVESSAIDIGAVEPDGWIDHIAAVVPQRTLVPIARARSRSWIRRGLTALLRRAAPKNWDDLEARGFAGDLSVMAFIREFPGLESFRLPDRTYDESVVAALIDEVPF